MDEDARPPASDDPFKREPSEVNRYVLVPRAQRGEGEGEGGPGMRRFSLARVGVSPRSALGEDRHERLERAAEPRRREP